MRVKYLNTLSILQAVRICPILYTEDKDEVEDSMIPPV